MGKEETLHDNRRSPVFADCFEGDEDSLRFMYAQTRIFSHSLPLRHPSESVTRKITRQNGKMMPRGVDAQPSRRARPGHQVSRLSICFPGADHLRFLSPSFLTFSLSLFAPFLFLSTGFNQELAGVEARTLSLSCSRTKAGCVNRRYFLA